MSKNVAKEDSSLTQASAKKYVTPWSKLEGLAFAVPIQSVIP